MTRGRHGSLVTGAGAPGRRAAGALAVAVLVGGLGGAAAVGTPELAAGVLAAVGAVLGASAAGVVVLVRRAGHGPVASGLAASATTGLAGMVLASLALRGDQEVADSLLGTTLMAAVLGLVCATIANLLLEDRETGAAAD